MKEENETLKKKLIIAAISDITNNTQSPEEAAEMMPNKCPSYKALEMQAGSATTTV